MDVMALRRMMAQMAAGAQFIKGSFTVPNDDSSTYTLNFGKTFSKYLGFIEADDSAKQQILSSGISDRRTVAFSLFYPNVVVGNNTIVQNNLNILIKPSDETGSGLATNLNLTSSSITANITTLLDTSGYSMYRLIKGCTYNYYIVEIK